jgi:hypothetical protein
MAGGVLVEFRLVNRCRNRGCCLKRSIFTDSSFSAACILHYTKRLWAKFTPKYIPNNVRQYGKRTGCCRSESLFPTPAKH